MKLPTRTVCLALLLLPGRVSSGEARPTDIASDEQILFFPSAAQRSEDGANWTVLIRGWIFEPEEHDFLRNRILNKIEPALSVPLNRKSQAILKRRIHYFLVDSERNKRIGIRICERRFTMPPSASNGHFQGHLTISSDLVAEHSRSGWLSFDVPHPAGRAPRFAGQVRLRPDFGVTIISDIDDTVKISHVTDRPRLIAGTFLRDFQEVNGMSGLYRSWADKGADLIFVSASPLQLYPALSDWLRATEFPPAVGPVPKDTTR